MPDQTDDLTQRAEKVAARWRVSIVEPLKLHNARCVYLTQRGDDLSVLKIYRKVGADGPAVPFLQGLQADLAVKLLRVSPLRRAVLMEWLQGPSLEARVAAGEEDEANAKLGQMAAALMTAPFKNPRVLPRMNKRLQTRFGKCASRLEGTAHQQNFARVNTLFENLVGTMKCETIIHGDLHYGNIIETPKGLRLIDPKGYRADPAVEFNRILVDVGEDHTIGGLMHTVETRAQVFSPTIDADPMRLIQWAAVMWGSRSLFHAAKAPRAHAPDDKLTAFLDLARA